MGGKSFRLIPIFLVLIATVNVHSQGFYRLPDEERQALITFYNATDGAHWTNNSGWLGAPGTECDWYGVICAFQGFDKVRRASVTSLSVSENGLKGSIPAQLEDLKSLEWLSLFGNRLEGSIPEPLIRNFLRGSLDIAAEANLFTDVSRIDHSWKSISLLCARKRVVLTMDGGATSYESKCRKATPGDRVTFCEVRKGRVGARDFAKLAWLMADTGFFHLPKEYSRNITHGVKQTTRVTRHGSVVSITDYAHAGPLELWTIQRAIEGVAYDIEWEKAERTPECPE